VHRLGLQRGQLLHALLPVLLEEGLVLVVFEVVEVREVFAFEAVLVREAPRLEDGFFDERGRGGRLLGDDAVLAEDVIPV
jgi:hypothetical protein